MRAHKLVAETAIALTHELYSELMKDDKLRRQFVSQTSEMGEKKREELFVEKYWTAALAVARTTLTEMLNRPMEESLKEQIADALIKDAAFVPGRIKAEGRLAK